MKPENTVEASGRILEARQITSYRDIIRDMLDRVYREIFDYTVAIASFDDKGDKLVLTQEELEGVERIASAYATSAAEMINTHVVRDGKSPKTLAELDERFNAARSQFALKTVELNMQPSDAPIYISVVKHFSEWCENSYYKILHYPNIPATPVVARVH